MTRTKLRSALFTALGVMLIASFAAKAGDAVPRAGFLS